MAKKSNDYRFWAFLVMFLGPLGFAVTYLAKKHDNGYVVHYAKQMLAFVIALTLFGVLVFVPLLGPIALTVIAVMSFILWLIGWIYALQGQKKDLPYMSKYVKELFKGF